MLFDPSLVMAPHLDGVFGERATARLCEASADATRTIREKIERHRVKVVLATVISEAIDYNGSWPKVSSIRSDQIPAAGLIKLREDVRREP